MITFMLDEDYCKNNENRENSKTCKHIFLSKVLLFRQKGILSSPKVQI